MPVLLGGRFGLTRASPAPVSLGGGFGLSRASPAPVSLGGGFDLSRASPRPSRSGAVSACHERPPRPSRSGAVSACHERPPRPSRSERFRPVTSVHRASLARGRFPSRASAPVSLGGGFGLSRASPAPVSLGGGFGLSRALGGGFGLSRAFLHVTSVFRAFGLSRASPAPVSLGGGFGLSRASPAPVSLGGGFGLSRASPAPVLSRASPAPVSLGGGFRLSRASTAPVSLGGGFRLSRACPAPVSLGGRFPLVTSVHHASLAHPASPTPPSPQPASYARSAPPAGIARPVCSTTKWKSLLISVVTACIAPRHLKRKPKAEPKHQRCFWEKNTGCQISHQVCAQCFKPELAIWIGGLVLSTSCKNQTILWMDVTSATLVVAWSLVPVASHRTLCPSFSPQSKHSCTPTGDLVPGGSEVRGFPVALYKNQGFQSPNRQSKPPKKGLPETPQMDVVGGLSTSISRVSSIPGAKWMFCPSTCLASVSCAVYPNI